jgi:hypothetical protein
MIKKLKESTGNIIGFEISEKLHDDDYKTFVPQIEQIINKEGKARILVHFIDFRGWDLHAAWDDFVFGVKHFRDIERIAMIGEKGWEEWMAKFCKPFTKAEVRYFVASELQNALEWLKGV